MIEMEESNKRIEVEIDGKKKEVEKGTTILEAASELGIDIPTLCYHPNLSTYSACRMCAVKITDGEGKEDIVTSCNYPIKEEIEVETHSEEVEGIREMLIEFLLARCPNDEKIREIARKYGIKEPRLLLEDVEETCILCGLCARVCNEIVKTSAIDFTNRGVAREVDAPFNSFSEECIGCGTCAMVCPTPATEAKRNIFPTPEGKEEELGRKFLKGKKDENLGRYVDIFSAKAKVEGQDGGVVTSLLLSGLEKGLFETAIVAQRKEGYKTEAVFAESPEEIKNASGTKYLRISIEPKLEEAAENGKKKIAIVGTPCQVRVARNIQEVWMDESKDMDITVVGLFCFESFDYEKLKKSLDEKLGVDLDEAERTQISKGNFIINDGEEEEYSCKVKELDEAIEDGCDCCDDFVSRLADISVGSVGSSDGYSTVIVRSKRGEKLLIGADLSKEEVNRESIERLVSVKEKRAKKTLEPFLEYDITSSF